jgi:hypothetical protein
MPQPALAHIPTAAGADCHLVQRVNADGSCVVRDKNTVQRIMIRLGALSVASQLTIVAVGPGSGWTW